MFLGIKLIINLWFLISVYYKFYLVCVDMKVVGVKFWKRLINFIKVDKCRRKIKIKLIVYVFDIKYLLYEN